MTTQQVVMGAAEMNAFMAREFPQVAADYRIERIAPMEAEIRLLTGYSHLRPGGTVSGPTMFALADLAVYAVLLGMIGPVALAVTTNASIDFMRKPEAGRDMIATARLLKLGRVLAVAEIHLRSEGSDALVARASMTYSIPPRSDSAA